MSNRSLRCGTIPNSEILIFICHQTETSGKRLREATPRSGKHDTSWTQIPLVEDLWARTESQFSRKSYQS